MASHRTYTVCQVTVLVHQTQIMYQDRARMALPLRQRICGLSDSYTKTYTFLSTLLQCEYSSYDRSPLRLQPETRFLGGTQTYISAFEVPVLAT